MLAEHGRVLAQLDRRLGWVEGDLDLVKVMLEAVRHEPLRRAERLKDELLTALGRETRVELLAAQGLTEDRLNAMERRLLALEGGEGDTGAGTGADEGRRPPHEETLE